jgi:hypothetical protein
MSRIRTLALIGCVLSAAVAAPLAAWFAAGAAGAAHAVSAAGPPPAIKPNLPSLFAHEITAIDQAKTAPPVLLPTTVPLERTKLYASGGTDKSGWDVSIGAVKNCGGADACFVADFEAIKGRKTFGTPVTLKGATKAAYKPMSCGASCAPATIDFIVHGVLYLFQVQTLQSRNAKATMIAAAQSAIEAGAR